MLLAKCDIIVSWIALCIHKPHKLLKCGPALLSGFGLNPGTRWASGRRLQRVEGLPGARAVPGAIPGACSAQPGGPEAPHSSCRDSRRSVRAHTWPGSEWWGPAGWSWAASPTPPCWKCGPFSLLEAWSPGVILPERTPLTLLCLLFRIFS